MPVPAYATHTKAAVATNSATYVINKPASLAAGDLMIAHIVSNDTESITPPAGWTTVRAVNDASDSYAGVYARVATSDDVAASSYTLTLSNAAADTNGAIIRFTVNSDFALSDIQSNGAMQAGSGSGHSTSGITPTYSSGLLLLCLGSDTTGRNASSYAVATDNPTWTELYDDAQSVANIALAYATRTSGNATGNATASLSGTADDRSTILVYLPGLTRVSADVVIGTLSVQAPTVPTCVVDSPLTLTSSLPAPTVTANTSPYTNLTKNSGAWTNQNKS